MVARLRRSSKTFLWRRNLGESTFLVKAKWGNQLPRVLLDHSLDRVLGPGEVKGRFPSSDQLCRV